MGFLRRLLGGGETGGDTAAEANEAEEASDPAAIDEEERAHELELARFEQERTTDLVRRQQRYGDRSWTPPAQGGSRRAGDESEGGDAPADGSG